jgi:cell division protein FtsZ
MIDKILFLWVQWISDLIVKPGDINIDFADIKVVMQNSGNALLWIGYGAWEKRAIDAARKAIENPLLETNLDKARNIIFAVTWWHDLTPVEVKEAASVVEEIIDSDVNMIWWMTFDESYEDEVKVTIIATWFQEQSKDDILKTPKRDILWRPTRDAENFITRWLKKEIKNDDDEDNQEVKKIEEDYETPAFIRKKLKAN